MKIGDKIKITTSLPADGQTGIDHLIGQTRAVLAVERENGRPTGRITVSEFKEDHSPIVLQAGEYATD